jgi:penicillin-binding protein 2
MTDIMLGRKPPPRARLGFRFAVFGLVIVLVIGLLTTRLFYLQVVQGGYYAGLSQENQHALIPLRSARGLVYDRAGRQLAINIPSYVVKLRPADLPFAERDAVVNRLSTLLQIPASDILQSIDRYANQSFDLVRLASDVPSDVARIIVEESTGLPGVQVSVEERREYEYGPLVSHVMGYTGAVSADELAELNGDGDYLNDDQIGKTGVEATFEDVLRGTYGEQEVEQDALGRVLRTVAVTQQPQAGDSLELTIDVEIQRQAEEALAWATKIVDLQRGVVIVMNPQTGEILAMVSNPTYDDNDFATGISNDEYQALINDPNRPLVNFGISEQYPPGSTYKLVTGSGALEDGVITPTTLVETAGYLEIGSYKYYDWNRTGFGPLDIYGGFAQSSDTFFYQMAGDLGIDRLGYWANQWGYGQRTGIDLPAEARGIVPTNDWKENLFNQPIYPGEVYQAGIGQGYDAATPLQVLNSYNALANGGSLLKPQIVRRVLAPDGTVIQDFQPELIHKVDVDPNTLLTMRLAAREVVTSRHTFNLVDLPLVVSGKTGTAEFGVRDSQGRLPYHTWFAAFVPKFTDTQPGDPAATDSELAILAFAYDSNTKGNAAVEIVKYFLQQHYNLGVDLTRPDLLAKGNFYGGH